MLCYENYIQWYTESWALARSRRPMPCPATAVRRSGHGATPRPQQRQYSVQIGHVKACTDNDLPEISPSGNSWGITFWQALVKTTESGQTPCDEPGALQIVANMRHQAAGMTAAPYLEGEVAAARARPEVRHLSSSPSRAPSGWCSSRSGTALSLPLVGRERGDRRGGPSRIARQITLHRSSTRRHRRPTMARAVGQRTKTPVALLPLEPGPPQRVASAPLDMGTALANPGRAGLIPRNSQRGRDDQKAVVVIRPIL